MRGGTGRPSYTKSLNRFIKSRSDITMKRISLSVLAVFFAIASAVLAQDVQKDQVDAKALFENKCSACHSIDRSKSKKKTASAWADIVKRMRRRGAAVTDQEAKIIVDYLAENYGKQ
jgi:cytochrome c2